ncbi:DNA mismatch repair protein MutS [Paenibacillus sp. GSMTC-2017]|uniref:endonuclease MutS2 n=1 Tax=Paenibacillus sp. GSMTC-2017 TaxID=2794350 RepID=UPI0018D6B746|nr:DNA mismatch repair protein MutS [Paenibacillus sp. GSMTC-2017]MBH5317754.1 DNA mismatch repair protein MutS [Paenibacillus sp. GSMTC-2017]
MNEATLVKLEFSKVKEIVVSMAVSPAGKKLAEGMKPSSDYGRVLAWQQETFEGAELLASGASIPLSAMDGIEPFLSLLGKGRIYTEQELEQLVVWLTSVAQMKRYMNSKRHIAPTISGYADSMHDCPLLREELERCLRYGILRDEASADLAYIRRQIYSAEDKIHRRMEQAMGKYRSFLQENVISKRSERFVLSVKRELRKHVPGSVLDESSSGQTVFIEPTEVTELQRELQQWKTSEDRERTVILSKLSQLADDYSSELKTNVQAMASLDYLMARAKFARSCGGKRIEICDEPIIKLVGAKHPFLPQASIPLDVELGIGWKQLMITGPNTGGKTVTLKTIGLFTIMNQSGLLIPAEQGSKLGLFKHIVADVGDGQSLEQNLSTFSSHITVLGEMLKHAGPRSLLLLDELAAGTDPTEGIALSIAVLEQFLERDALVVATTHFNEIKTFAAKTKGCQNGRMAFDPETLQPLYRLEIGEAGDSQAFAIARRYGLPETVVIRAEKLLLGRNNAARIEIPEATRYESESVIVSESTKRNKHNVDKNKLKLDVSNEFNAKDSANGGRSQSDNNAPIKKKFEKGDVVWIYPLKRAGVVYQPADVKGVVIVQVKEEKLSFNHKRLKIYIPKEKLYPDETYDLDIVFESKENRKIRHSMSRKHVEGLEITISQDQQR